MTQSWQARFVLNKDQWIVMDSLLSDVFPALVVKPVRKNDPHSPEQICLIFPEKPERDKLLSVLNDNFAIFDLAPPDIVIEPLPDIDWLQHVYDSLKPIEAGRFFVHGAHVTDIPVNSIPVVIEAAAAFGTGEHPTTKGCLSMFDRILHAGVAPTRILDMGCGSGILAIAAAKTVPGANPIIGVDIDAQSVRVATTHAGANGTQDRTVFIHGDAFHTPQIKDAAPFDLVFANILAQPLIDMADDIAAVATGHILLSGFTRDQSPYVEKPYVKNGFTVRDTLAIDEWMTLWLTR
jgi:ribosomal protein L11 methyltransferase